MVLPSLLTDLEIDRLINMAKPIADGNWHQKLLDTSGSDNLNRRGSFSLLPVETGPLRGDLWLYARQNLDPQRSQDFSTGLVFESLQGHSYNMIRCDGPSHIHRNRIEGGPKLRNTAHIHRLTERYQLAANHNSDGYAEATDQFSTLKQAVSHLAEIINLVPDGRLFLPLPTHARES